MLNTSVQKIFELELNNILEVGEYKDLNKLILKKTDSLLRERGYFFEDGLYQILIKPGSISFNLEEGYYHGGFSAWDIKLSKRIITGRFTAQIRQINDSTLELLNLFTWFSLEL